MKAAVIERQGGPEGLVWREWPDPVPGAGEVLVKVRVCGLNHLDIFVRRGMPGFPVPIPFISGGDIAGEVVGHGPGVSAPALGSRVVLNPSTPRGMIGEQLPGGMAELVVAPADHAIPIPDAVGYREAACLPVAYGTARRMLVARARLQAGETVLVLGASGGVGNGCVQIAKNLGARVIAAAGEDDKLARLRAMGADEVINYRTEDFSAATWRLTGRKGVDVVVNFTGGDTWVPSLKTLRKGGRLVTCGATAGFEPRTDIRYIWVRELNILGSDGWSSDDIRALLDDVAAGRIVPAISHVLPMAEARAAEELIEDRGIFGKVLLEP